MIIDRHPLYRDIALQFKIYQGNPSLNILLYSEVHMNVLTDTFGLYSLVIGSKSGTGVGTFNTIAWSTATCWIEVYIDPTNGTNFIPSNVNRPYLAEFFILLIITVIILI